MKVGDMITFREWAVDGKFKYPLDFSTDADIHQSMDCVEITGEPVSNDFYQQVSLRAKSLYEGTCEWNMQFKSADEKDIVDIKFVVSPFIITYESETSYTVKVGQEIIIP
jgi:hypothetical protein